MLKQKSGVEPKSEQRRVGPVLEFGGDYGRAQENGEEAQQSSADRMEMESQGQ